MSERSIRLFRHLENQNTFIISDFLDKGGMEEQFWNRGGMEWWRNSVLLVDT